MNTNGIGIGLVIANQIVRQFDGTINFTSVEGKGSSFVFSIKLEDFDK